EHCGGPVRPSPAGDDHRRRGAAVMAVWIARRASSINFCTWSRTMASKAEAAKRRAKSPPDVAKWQALAQTELKGKPVSSLDWHTPEGIAVKPLYTEADL